MKAILFIFGCAVFIGSCTRQSDEWIESEQPIRFEVSTINNNSRSNSITGDTGDNPLLSMAVFCAYTNEATLTEHARFEYMHNALVERSGTAAAWITADGNNKNWGGNGYHSFVAFAPHNVAGVDISPSTQPGLPSLTYTMPDRLIDQIDLLYSNTGLFNSRHQYLGNKPVSLGFQHALSKVSFNAQKESGMEREVKIVSISLSDIQFCAEFNFRMNGVYSAIESGYWTMALPLTTKTFALNGASGLSDLLLSQTSAPLIQDGKSIFILPQSLSGTSMIRIVYTEDSTTKQMERSLADVTPLAMWELGKGYTYTIVITQDDIDLAAEITPWKDVVTDTDLHGTYLNVSARNLQIEKGNSAIIRYATDAESITAACDKGVELVHDATNKTVLFPSTAETGTYRITIDTGTLQQKIMITVV